MRSALHAVTRLCSSLTHDELVLAQARSKQTQVHASTRGGTTASPVNDSFQVLAERSPNSAATHLNLSRHRSRGRVWIALANA